MAAKTTRQTSLPTFRITDDASFEEFAALCGIVLKDKGALPMVALMRAAADQGRAFTIDGYKPSDAVVSPSNYTIRYITPSTPDGAEKVLHVDEIRKAAGVEKSKGRVALDVFRAAIATLTNTPRAEWVVLTYVMGDTPDSVDLTVKQSRPRKGKVQDNAGAESTDAPDNGSQDDSADNGEDVDSDDNA